MKKDEKLAQNFMRSEFACKCGCGLDSIDPDTVTYCQEIRDFFDRPVTIESGCRCPAHNMTVGGARKSQHLLNKETGYSHAADIVVQGIPAHVVQEFCEQIDVPGLGYYESFTHIDTREGFARW